MLQISNVTDLIPGSVVPLAMFGYKVIVGTNMGVLLGTSGTLGTWVWQCTRQAVLHHFGSKRRCFHLKLIHPHLFCPFKLLSLSELLRKFLMPPPLLINSSRAYLRQLQVVTHFQSVARAFIFFVNFLKFCEISVIKERWKKRRKKTKNYTLLVFSVTRRSRSDSRYSLTYSLTE